MGASLAAVPPPSEAREAFLDQFRALVAAALPFAPAADTADTAAVVFAAVTTAVGPLVERMDRLERALDPKLTNWIDRKATAVELGCCVETVDKLIKDGKLRTQKLGRAIRIDAASLHPSEPAEIRTLVRKALAK